MNPISFLSLKVTIMIPKIDGIVSSAILKIVMLHKSNIEKLIADLQTENKQSMVVSLSVANIQLAAIKLIEKDILDTLAQLGSMAKAKLEQQQEENKEKTFEPGDEVYCTDAGGYSSLKVDQGYTVREVRNDRILLKGINGTFYPGLFIKAEMAKFLTEQPPPMIDEDEGEWPYEEGDVVVCTKPTQTLKMGKLYIVEHTDTRFSHNGIEIPIMKFYGQEGNWDMSRFEEHAPIIDVKK